MSKITLSLIFILNTGIAAHAKELKHARTPAQAKGDAEVEIKSYGGSYPHVVRIVDTKNKLVCYAVTNSNNATALSCLPLTQ